MSHEDSNNDAPIQSEGADPPDKRRRLTSLKSVIMEVIKLQSYQQFLQPALEPLLRKVVKEEVELALRKHLGKMIQSPVKEDNASPHPRSLKLHFLNNLSFPLFTTSQIGGDNWSTIKVVLLDADTADIVNTGSLSSSKVEILVLEGDFDCSMDEGWTVEEFENNIVKERDGKKPLINGNAFFYLKDGIGSMGEFAFTDNSSWTRSRKFRLGARVVDCFEGIRIREAKSEPFVVRDQRGELYKKHHPPALSDEVWRLEKIRKDGAFHRRLYSENIHTVQDFLTLFYLNPSRLRKILGSGMSLKMWEVTLDHALNCTIDKKLYMYTIDPQRPSAVIFNVVGRLAGMISGTSYISADNLSDPKKVEAKKHILWTFEQHWADLAVIEEENLVAGPPYCPSGVGAPEMTRRGSWSDRVHPTPSSMPVFSPVSSFGYATEGLEGCGAENICDSGGFIYGMESVADALCGDHLAFLDSDFCTSPGSWGGPQGGWGRSGRLRLPRAAEATAQMRWRMVFSVIQWLWVKRVVKSSRRALKCHM